MCGISGFVLHSGERPEVSLIEKMTERLRTRGPDAGAVAIKDNIAFGHRRLKIIDLSDSANQPMNNQKNDVSLVFNGEIYNFKELREDLKKMGRVFRTHSDTEVLLQAYEVWGINSFKKFNGMFAFAIADFRGDTPELFLVRDRWGIKPLYFSWYDQKLGFASTPSALLDLPWVKKNIDKNSLAHFLRFAHFPQNESVYKDINQVIPGTFFHYKDSKLESKRYFHPSEIMTNHISDAGNIDSVLESAVDRQMVSDTDVGCFLSGGIDSSLLVAYASKMHPKLKTRKKHLMKLLTLRQWQNILGQITFHLKWAP
jgi:asparagine synthase (glutamine-hydrolysing)